LCELNIAVEQGITPKASAFRREDGTLESRQLEDMAPFLPREEIWENMHLFDEED
jgi:acetolactate synthase-1/2/3 large subunit